MRRAFLTFGFSLICLHVTAQSPLQQKSLELRWKGPSEKWNPDQMKWAEWPVFEKAAFDAAWSDLPYRRFKISVPDQVTELEIVDERFENRNLSNEGVLSRVEKIRWTNATASKQRYLLIDIVPFDPSNGRILKSFKVRYRCLPNNQKTQTSLGFAAQSVLASGQWYKMSVENDGIYRITPSFLQSSGLDASNLSIQGLRVFGNGGGMLPEENADPWIDDLKELPVEVLDENSNGLFDGNDQILFYATGPHKWTVSGNEYAHEFNLYTDRAYYFLNVGSVAARSIQQAAPVSAPSTEQSFSFDDRQFSEKDINKVVDSGKQWFDEKYEYTLSYNYGFNFPNIVSTEPVLLTCRAIARSSVSGTRMELSQGGQQRLSMSFDAVSNGQGADFVNVRKASASFLPASSSVSLTATYNNAVNPAGVAWMDYVRLQARRQLDMAGLQQMAFRDLRTVGAGKVTEFNLSNCPSGLKVWEVSDIHELREMPLTVNGTNAVLRVRTDSLREFVAFHGTSFPTPQWVGSVANQDLHGTSVPELLIVYPASLEAPALRLAQFHRDHSGLTVEALPLDHIYNEFSGGTPDLTAIKNLCRMYYERSSPSSTFKFLTLFGDASYDYQDRITNNTNLVPTWQSFASFSLNTSYCTDDYFGFLDPPEGGASTLDLLDIGIGRLPVRNTAEGEALVDKIVAYASDPDALGNWRTSLLFAADDVDEGWEGLLMGAAENAAQRAYLKDPRFNQQKIYQDSYTQIVTGGSERYPKAREDLKRSIENGQLVCAFTGHGGEIGLSSERILQVPDIQTFGNAARLPLFITITCEFSRFDDPKRISAGEYGLLNPNGGFIALYSTQRVVYASQQTLDLTRDIFDTLFTRVEDKRITLGDVIRSVKNSNGSSDKLKFSLFGDPALSLSIPQLNVQTTAVNGVPVAGFTDTLKALTPVTVSGEVVDLLGQRRQDFNGRIIPVVYDKSVQRQTLVNDGVGQPLPFEEQSSVIYRGLAEVVDGVFSFSFVVPLDISYQFGSGRITYYAENGDEDAAGYFEDFTVGGLDTSAAADDQGPEISLYMNDDQFVNGGITDEDPAIYAVLIDSSGINTIGRGIGHDILAILDGDINNSIVLNEYYTADLNSFRSGKVLYDLSQIPEGPHSLKLRAWDVYNNPGETTIDFVVANSENLALRHVLNYPNPFTSYTEFQFEHNRANQPLQIRVQIFSASGQLVKSLQQEVVPDGNRITGIVWDGRDDYGDPIGKGVYVYKISVRSKTDGSQAEEYQKLVILR